MDETSTIIVETLSLHVGDFFQTCKKCGNSISGCPTPCIINIYTSNPESLAA